AARQCRGQGPRLDCTGCLVGGMFRRWGASGSLKDWIRVPETVRRAPRAEARHSSPTREERTVSHSAGYGGSTSLVSGDAVPLDLRPAGFASRAVAFGIDFLVQFAALVASLLTLALLTNG